MELQPKTPEYPEQFDQYKSRPQQHQQSSVIVISQPMAAFAPSYQPQNIRAWSTGICGCCEDCHSCLLGFLCPPIHWCCLASKMDECVVGPLFCGSLFTIAMRTKLRTMYGIRGSIVDDCCTLAWCPCCAATQMHRELKISGYA